MQQALLRAVVALFLFSTPQLSPSATTLVGDPATPTALDILVDRARELVQHPDRFPADDASQGLLRNAWSTIEAAAMQLRQRGEHRAMSEEYVSSLRSSAEAMDRLFTANDPPERRLGICLAVQKDLVAKLKAAVERDGSSYGPKPPGGPEDTCQIRVKTLQHGSELKGCTVWCVPVAWNDSPARYIRFESLSSPTSKELQTGYYEFWAEYGGKAGKRTPLEVVRLKILEIDAP